MPSDTVGHDVSGGVDFHNHVMPGVDDGAMDDAEAAAALQAFLDAGFTRIVATPHIDGSLTLRPDALAGRLREIDAGWDRLIRIVREQYSGLQVLRGAEIMLDTPEPDLSDARLRLAGGAYALVEYPYMTVPPHSAGVLRTIIAAGTTPIIAHPERYAGVTPESVLAREWRGAGALLQLNAGSLTGRYGPQPRSNALGLLEQGLADYICSDYHARGRISFDGARRTLIELGGAEHAELLMSVNPRRLLAGQPPIPVPPLRLRLGTWQRLRRWLA
jgi:protein-tyrosine phosphatase